MDENDFCFITSLWFGTALLVCMSLEKRMTQVWVSWETYRRLLAVRGAMRMADGKIRNMDEVIAELIEFWKKRSENMKALTH
jgi:hypothetical protein